jgi:hypothetical protein
MRMSEQAAINTNDTWAYLNLNENEMKERTFKYLKRKLVKVLWNPYERQNNGKYL